MDCPICETQYNSNSGAICLSCGQRICKSCDQGIRSSGNYKCPFCRESKLNTIGYTPPIQTSQMPVSHTMPISHEPPAVIQEPHTPMGKIIYDFLHKIVYGKCKCASKCKHFKCACMYCRTIYRHKVYQTVKQHITSNTNTQNPTDITKMETI